MDDLEPDRARPELWRRFAAGERGPAVGRVGGIRDRSSLALSAARMRADPVFRDAAHHFLRLFDGTLAEVAPDATDADLDGAGRHQDGPRLHAARPRRRHLRLTAGTA